MQLLARDSIRIVHIDDDNDFADLSVRGLRRAGFTHPVVRCTDGLLVLYYFSKVEPESAPHVILLDLHMPGMNGLEVLHWVRESYANRDVAVYLLTSSEDPSHRQQAACDRVTEFLTKSCFGDQLIEQLDDLIERNNGYSARKPSEGLDANLDPAPLSLMTFPQELAQVLT